MWFSNAGTLFNWPTTGKKESCGQMIAERSVLECSGSNTFAGIGVMKGISCET